MRLIYCIPSLYNPGGMERVITEKVNYLANLPHWEIVIVTTDQLANGVYFSLDNRIKIIHFDIDFNAHYHKNLIEKYLLHKKKLHEYKIKLTQIIQEIKPDICISLCGKEIEFFEDLPSKCCKVAEIHFSMNHRKQFIKSLHKGFFWHLLGVIRTCQLKQSVKRLDKLVVLTKLDKLQWEKSHSNVIQIPNSNPLINESVSDLNSKRVISIGRLDAQKGYDMLIEAWSIVNEKHPDWVLDIFGIGEWEQMLLTQIKARKLTGVINLKGITADVLNNYVNSSIYVMSSRYEGFGMVLIEAMSCGLPVISFDCEYGPSEIITDGVDGFLVQPNNIVQLAEKICLLIENESKRKIMGCQASESVKRYSKEPIMQQWVDLFENLIKSK